MTSRYQKRRNYESNKHRESSRLKWKGLYDTPFMREAFNGPHPKIKARTLFDYYEWLWTNGYKDRVPDLRAIRRQDPTPLDSSSLHAAWRESEMCYPGPDRDPWPYKGSSDEDLRDFYLPT